MNMITKEQARVMVDEWESQVDSQRAAAVKERLRSLVLYAKERSPYFQNAYNNIGQDFVLSDLPVTSKTELMRNYDDWVTDPELTLSLVRDYLSDVRNTSNQLLERYTALTTSGSTSEPMPMVRDGYHNMIHGCLINQRLFRGIDPNLLNPVYSRIATIIMADGFVSSYSSAVRIKSAAGEFAKNFEIFSLLTPLNQLVEQLNEFNPQCVTGYPSVLVPLAKEQSAGRLKIAPKVIASSAELLSIEAYQSLKQAFDCPVLNNYCSTEGGEIAMSCSMGHLHLNEDWVILEPVDAKLCPVERGAWSEGVLITDLSNYVQPIIRYYVKDSVRIGKCDCECGSTLPVIEISGRSGDPLCFGGKTMPFLVLYVVMLKIGGLLSWQLIQIGDHELEVRYVAEENQDITAIEKKLSSELYTAIQEYGCGEVNITFSDKGFIHNARGGKVPYTVCQFE